MEAALPKDFGFGSDEEMLRDLAKQLLDEEMPIEKLRRLVAADPAHTYDHGHRPAWDEALWKRCVDLGWPGLAVPENAGGAGFKMVGIVALVEELGRHCLPSPLVATLNATYVLRASSTPAAAAWLARIADGASASLAMTDATGAWDVSRTDVVARDVDGGLSLTGRACFVQDAFKADFLLVNAKTGEGTVLCAVPVSAAGVALRQDHIHDLTRDQATVVFEDVVVAQEDIVCEDGGQALRAAWPAILATVAADLCGTGEWQLQTTVEYAKVRKQFDRPIGFFQAVKHPLSNAMIEVDRARSLLYWAACCIDEGHPDALRAARMAKSAASDAGRFISDRSVQLHGGIGFTWECDIHLYFKRSMHNQALYGDGVHQRRRLADELIGPLPGC